MSKYFIFFESCILLHFIYMASDHQSVLLVQFIWKQPPCPRCDEREVSGCGTAAGTSRGTQSAVTSVTPLAWHLARGRKDLGFS